MWLALTHIRLIDVRGKADQIRSQNLPHIKGLVKHVSLRLVRVKGGGTLQNCQCNVKGEYDKVEIIQWPLLIVQIAWSEIFMVPSLCCFILVKLFSNFFQYCTNLPYWFMKMYFWSISIVWYGSGHNNLWEDTLYLKMLNLFNHFLHVILDYRVKHYDINSSCYESLSFWFVLHWT